MQSCVDCYPGFPFAVCIGVDGQQDFLTVEQTRLWHHGANPVADPVRQTEAARPTRFENLPQILPSLTQDQMPAAQSRALQRAESAAEHAFAQVTIVIACPVVRCSAP